MRYIIVTILVCFALVANAQQVKVITATSQSWSGGVAGHHGTNYAFKIQFADTNITPDTAWIGGKYFPLRIDKKDTAVRNVDRRHNTVTYTFTAADSYVDPGAWRDRNYIEPKKDTITKKPYKNYDGAALLTYSIHRVQHTFLIKSFTQLTPLNYP
jgi:hypothetical protein